MTRRNRYQGHWCALMAFHLGRLRLTGSAFAARLGLSQQVVHAYLAGKLRPPVADLPAWAEALGLSKAEREQMLEAAYESHTPAVIWDKLLALRAELDSERASKIPPDMAAELKRLRDVLRLAHDALARLDAWSRVGRPLPGNIATVLHKALAATAVVPGREKVVDN